MQQIPTNHWFKMIRWCLENVRYVDEFYWKNISRIRKILLIRKILRSLFVIILFEILLNMMNIFNAQFNNDNDKGYL